MILQGVPDGRRAFNGYPYMRGSCGGAALRGLGDLGLVTQPLPRPGNIGAISGNEFDVYRDEFDSLSERVNAIMSMAAGIDQARAQTVGLDFEINQFASRTAVAVTKINENFEWDYLTTRSPERTAQLQNAYGQYMAAIRDFVNRAEPMVQTLVPSSVELPSDVTGSVELPSDVTGSYTGTKSLLALGGSSKKYLLYGGIGLVGLLALALVFRKKRS